MPAPTLSGQELRSLATATLDVDGDLAAHKVVTRRDVIVAVAPSLYGRHPSELGVAVGRVLGYPEAADGSRALRATPVGAAADALNEVSEERRRLLARVERAGGRKRRQLRREAEAAAVQEAHRRAAFEKLAEVERDRLSRELPEARTEASERKGQHEAARRFALAHPEATHRLAHLDRQIADAAYKLDLDRQALDGIAPPGVRHHELDGATPRLERALDLGIDL